MPTDEELKAYLGEIPPIYRDILAAYPELNPERKVGTGLMADAIVGRIHDERYDEDETLDALTQLEQRGFLARNAKLGTLGYSPTAIGERAITLLTGHTPRPKGAPPLPPPTWG